MSEITPFYGDPFDKYFNREEIEQLLSFKANIDSFYSKLQADARFQRIDWLPTFAQIQAKPSTKDGFGITDVDTSAQVDAKIAALIGAAPGVLDTLAEIAAALGNDPNFATTITTQLASKSDKATTYTKTEATALFKSISWFPAFSQILNLPTTKAGYGLTDVYSITETNAAIQAVIGAAPGALDTLVELATALGNDPNFATTMTNALAGKADKASTYTKTEVDTLQRMGFADYVANFTLQASDGGKMLRVSNAAGVTCSIPADATLNLPIGFVVVIRQVAAGAVTFAPSAGVTLLSPNGLTKTATINAQAVLVKESANQWSLEGNIV
jgi:precorrin isomerase